MLLPSPTLAYNMMDQSQMRAEIEREDGQNWKRGRDIELAQGERLILRSPDGARWALAVDNAGVLSAVSI